MLEKYPLLKQLKADLVSKKVPHFANDNISEMLTPEARAQMQAAVQEKVEELLNILLIDVDNDHNSSDTPRRVAKMLINETLKGRYDAPPQLTNFPNARDLDQMIVATKIRVESLCSHHHQNIRGFCHIGMMPNPDKGSVIGLSKFSRIVDWFSRRPQIQEELTSQIANFLMQSTDCLGVAVIIVAEHQCMSVRGVCEHDALTTTSVLRGCFQDDQGFKDEFMRQIQLSVK